MIEDRLEKKKRMKTPQMEEDLILENGLITTKLLRSSFEHVTSLGHHVDREVDKEFVERFLALSVELFDRVDGVEEEVVNTMKLCRMVLTREWLAPFYKDFGDFLEKVLELVNEDETANVLGNLFCYLGDDEMIEEFPLLYGDCLKLVNHFLLPPKRELIFY